MEGSAAYYEKLHKKAVEIGIDVLYVADDFAFNMGLFVRPELFEQIWRPYAARILQPALDAGVPILFHSDGRIDDAVEMLSDLGVDGLNPMDPSGIDYADYKKRFGHRLTLSGNIDITFPLVGGTPEDVRADVKKHMDVLKPGGRYIAASSHSIVDYIPHENYLAMVEAVHEFGRY
jgi:uroporphyrinogen decarboxylase